MSRTKTKNHDKIESGMRDKDKNCLPDGINTIQEKIEYVKSCYGIIGEKGKLFDWLISELKKENFYEIEKAIRGQPLEYFSESLTEHCLEGTSVSNVVQLISEHTKNILIQVKKELEQYTYYLKSENVLRTCYHEKENILELEYINETIYLYKDFPKELYDEMIQSTSIGSFLSTRVKGNYRYERIK